MKTHKTLVQLILCAIFSAILCICSSITVPIGPIAFSMAIFAVMLCGVTLPLRLSFVSVLVYLALGLFLPIFSGGNTGLTALPGPTGGYIWSFLLMIPVIRLCTGLSDGRLIPEYATAFAGCVLGIVLCYFCGTLQFSHVAGRSFAESLQVCVIPFILPDLIKAFAAALLGVNLRSLLRRMELLGL